MELQPAQLLRNIASSYIVRIVAILLDFIMLPLLSYGLGMERLGIWFLFQNGLTLLMRSDLGLGAATVRFVAIAQASGDKPSLTTTISTSLLTLSVGGIVIALLVVTFGNFAIARLAQDNSADYQSVIWIFALSTLAVGLPLSVFRQALIGLQRFDVMNFLRIVESLVRAVMFALLLHLSFGLPALALVDSSLFILTSLVAFGAVKRIEPTISISFMHFSIQTLRYMLPYGLQIAGMSLLTFAILQLDTIIVGAVVSIPMIAVYAAGHRLYQGCKEMTAALVQPFSPDAAYASSLANSQRIRSLFLSGSRFGLALTLLAGVPLYINAESVIANWVGPGYEDAAPVVQFLLLGLLVSNLHLVSSALLRGTGRIASYLGLQSIWATLNIALSIWLGREYGLIGVALGTTIPILLLEPFYVRIALNEFHVSLSSFIAEVIAPPSLTAIMAAAPMLALRLLFPTNAASVLLGLISVHCLLYLSCYWFVGTPKSERAYVLESVGRLRQHLKHHIVGGSPVAPG